MNFLRQLWSFFKAPPPDKKKSTKVVLVIGDTGVGKTSLINLIVGENVTDTSNFALRGTFKTDDYEFENFIMVDTAGYNDATEANPQEAFNNLAKFANKILTNGISLIVYVMKMGRLTATFTKNYDYFVQAMCKNNVPVLLVVTHCETEDDGGQQWYFQQAPVFMDLKMNFSDFVCGCAMNLTEATVETKCIPLLIQMRQVTRDVVLQMMEESALEEAWRPENRNEWIIKVFVGASAAFGLAFPALSAILPSLIPILGGSVSNNGGVFYHFSKLYLF